VVEAAALLEEQPVLVNEIRETESAINRRNFFMIFGFR
jgi:hypothetical protein